MTRDELALELLKLSTSSLYDKEDKTAENVVSTYNYFYENIKVDENPCDKE